MTCMHYVYFYVSNNINSLESFIQKEPEDQPRSNRHFGKSASVSSFCLLYWLSDIHQKILYTFSLIPLKRYGFRSTRIRPSSVGTRDRLLTKTRALLVVRNADDTITIHYPSPMTSLTRLSSATDGNNLIQKPCYGPFSLPLRLIWRLLSLQIIFIEVFCRFNSLSLRATLVVPNINLYIRIPKCVDL